MSALRTSVYAKLLVVMVAILSFGLVVVACGGSPLAPTPSLPTPTLVPSTPTPVPPTPTPVPSTPTPVPPTPTLVPPTPTPSFIVEDLIGLWHEESGDVHFLQFNEDGTFRAGSSEWATENTPYDGGQFQVEGTLITLTSNNKSSICKGQTGTYQLELTKKDQLQFTLVEDECGTRSVLLPINPLKRSLP